MAFKLLLNKLLHESINGYFDEIQYIKRSTEIYECPNLNLSSYTI